MKGRAGSVFGANQHRHVINKQKWVVGFGYVDNFVGGAYEIYCSKFFSVALAVMTAGSSCQAFADEGTCEKAVTTFEINACIKAKLDSEDKRLAKGEKV